MPDLGVMEQYVFEQDQVSKLYGVVRYGGLSNVPLGPAEKELFRRKLLVEKLNHMEDGHLGFMPDREMLKEIPLAEARQILRHKAVPLGISACNACQKVFFADTP